MGKRAKEDIVTGNFYVRYLAWVEDTKKSSLIKWWAISGGLSLLLVVAASIISFGGRWLSAIIALPAALALFVISLGIAHTAHLSSEKPTMRERYSPKQRRKIAGVLLAVVLVATILMSPHVPYAAGGTILLVCVLSLLNLARMTSQEVQYEEAGILDPRDLHSDVILLEDPDILDEEDMWVDEYDEDEEDYPLEEDVTDRRSR